MTTPIRSCVLFVVLSLTGCSGEETLKIASSEPENPPISIIKKIATLTEGTNMSVAVRPDTLDRVISLQGQLYLLAEHGEAKALTDAYFDAREPQFTSDGRSVLFQGYRAGNWDIWIVDLESGDTRKLTDDAWDDREPQATPSGIIFSSDRDGSYDIWRMEEGEISKVTDTITNAYSPSISTTGQIAYAERIKGLSRVVVLAEEPMVVAEQAGTISGVQWSPDATQISYQLLGAEGTQMRLVDIQSGGDAVLTIPGEDVFPFKASWIDSDTLAYTADGLVKKLTINNEVSKWPFSLDITLNRHIYSRKTRNYDPTLKRPVRGIAYPIVDNRGEQIFFTALGDIWNWQPRSESLIQLTNDAEAENGLALHPDGQSLAYVGETNGQIALQILDLTTSSVKILDLQAQSISGPTWSPDGKKLAVFVGLPGNPLGSQLIAIDITTGQQTRILKPMQPQPISWDAESSHVAVTRLDPYSSRYREGIYNLVIANIKNGEIKTINPAPHRSIVSASLIGTDEMAYVEGGIMHKLALSDSFAPIEKAVQITSDITDMPSWSSDGSHLVYLSGNRLKLYSEATGSSRDISPKLDFTLATPTERFIVRAGRVFTGEGDAYLENQDIEISGTRITAIRATDPSVEPDVDASAMAIFPGLFEMHAHMGETSEPQGRIWLSHGITTVRDPGSNPYVAKGRQEAWDSGRRAGPRTHITGYLTDGNRVYYSIAEGIVSDEHLELALARAKDLDLDFIKTYVRLADHLQKRVVEFAHNNGMPVSSHELYPAVAHGMDHVEHIGGTSRRGYQPKVSSLGYSYQDVVELLATGGMGITATAVLPGFGVILKEEPEWFETPQFMHFYGESARRGYEMMLQRFGNGVAATARANGRLLRELTKRDALLVTGTDSPFVPYGAGLHAELRLYARAGLTPAQILRQATIKSAEAAGVASELGTIQVGKLADLVIVDGDPLANIGDADNVVMTIKHGQRYSLDALLK